MCLGYDEQEKMKYWLIQNTWGPQWGENGFFRMKRGNDEFGIESICEVGTPVIFDNLNKRELSPEQFKTQSNFNNNDTILSVFGESNKKNEGQVSFFDLFKN